MVYLVGWRGGQTELNSIEAIQNGFETLVNGAMAFIGDDQVLTTDR